MGFTVDTRAPEAARDRSAALLLPPLAVLLIVVVLVFRVVYATVVVQGESMQPALRAWDYLLVGRGYGTPRRGDIVSVRPSTPGGTPFLKRVIGVPGDVVVLDGERASVNGAAEGPWTVSARDSVRGWVRRWEVPPGHVFLLGDNRPISQDSRYFGPVPVSAIDGRAVLVFWPPGSARRLDSPGRGQ